MIVVLFNEMVEFLESSVLLVGLLMAVVEYLKIWLKSYEWYTGWMTTVLAFVLAFVFAIPESGFELVPYIIHGFGLGLVATGVYKVGDGISRKTRIN